MNENAALERARGFRVVHPARGVGFGLLWEPAVLGVQMRGNVGKCGKPKKLFYSINFDKIFIFYFIYMS